MLARSRLDDCSILTISNSEEIATAALTPANRYVHSLVSSCT
jgi:hypothetical protein